MTHRVCNYCRKPLLEGAAKCGSCGEWMDGRRKFSAATKVCLALILGELLAMAGIAVQIPSYRAMLADFSSELAVPTRVALSYAWTLAGMGVVAGLVFASTGLTPRERRRMPLLAVALGVGGVHIALTWWGLHVPILELADKLAA